MTGRWQVAARRRRRRRTRGVVFKKNEPVGGFMKRRVFVDLDDVLVDFTGAACRLHGIDEQELRTVQRELRAWNMVPCIQKLTGREEFRLSDFWAPIHQAGADFWENLEPLPWANALLNHLQDVEWFILTSPSYNPDSHLGKIRWAHRFFDHYFDRMLLTRHKHVVAGVGTILIDDHVDNVLKFEMAGGKGVLFPASSNLLADHLSDPLPLVKERLDALLF